MHTIIDSRNSNIRDSQIITDIFIYVYIMQVTQNLNNYLSDFESLNQVHVETCPGGVDRCEAQCCRAVSFVGTVPHNVNLSYTFSQNENTPNNSPLLLLHFHIFKRSFTLIYDIQNIYLFAYLVFFFSLSFVDFIHILYYSVVCVLLLSRA